jgi:hypothetical protein
MVDSFGSRTNHSVITLHGSYQRQAKFSGLFIQKDWLHSGQFRDLKSLALHEKPLDLSNYEIFSHKILKSRTFKKSSILIVKKNAKAICPRNVPKLVVSNGANVFYFLSSLLPLSPPATVFGSYLSSLYS